MINGANPSDKTMMRACHSGNEEMIQILEDKGIGFTKDCLFSAISGWKNVLVQYIIEKMQDRYLNEETISGALLQASKYSNFSMVLFFIEKGADVNTKTSIVKSHFIK